MTSYIGLFCNNAGTWRVSFPDLPGCTARADDFEEALRAAQLALAACLDDMDEPPLPRSAFELLFDAPVDDSRLSLANTVMRPVSAGRRLDGTGDH